MDFHLTRHLSRGRFNTIKYSNSLDGDTLVDELAQRVGGCCKPTQSHLVSTPDALD